MVPCILAAFATCLLTLPLQADQLWANGSQRGVVLIWTPPRMAPLPERYTVRRAVSGTGRWLEIGTTVRQERDSTHSAIAATVNKGIELHSADSFHDLIRQLVRNPIAVAQRLGTYFEDTTTTPLTEYDYQVWSGSLLIAEATGVVSHQRNRPPAPEGIAARQRAQCIELWWSLDSARAVAGYAVYRAEHGKSPLRIIAESLELLSLEQDTLTAGYVRDCSIVPGARYTYFVASIDLFGNEGVPASIELECSPSTNVPPTISRIQLDPHRITIRTGEPDTTKQYVPVVRLRTEPRCMYPIFRHPPSAVELLTPESTADALAVATVTVSHMHWSWASIPLVVPVIDTIAPARPSVAELIQQGERAFLRWLPSHESDIAGYVLDRSNGTDTLTHVVPQDSTLLQIHSPLDWHYRLRAVDAHGNSSAPTPWTSLRHAQQLRPEVIAVQVFEHGTLLAWKPMPWAAQILVNRYDDTLATPVTIATLGGNAHSYIDRHSRRALYQIVAIDTAGRYSMPSERIGPRDQQRCTAPTIDSVVVRDGAVYLYWSPARSNLLVERKTDDSEDVTVLGYVDQWTRSFVDEHITPGTSYSYRLRCMGSRDSGTTITIRIPP